MIGAFAVILLCWSVQDASAIQRPKEKDLAEIREQLASANDETLDAGARDEAREKALWLTIRAFDILTFEYGGPVFPTRVSVLRSPQNGKKITFIPVVAGAGDYALQNEIGLRRGKVKLGVDESGNFSSDGIARIFPSAFANPGALASTILHEYQHFRQATTPGRGDVLTPGEMEVEAYAAQLADTESGFFPFTDEELDAEKAYLKKNLKKKRAQAAKERAEVTRRSGLPVDEFSVASLPTDAIARLADKAHQQVRIAQADHDDRLRNDLRDIALRSCASPGSITVRELRGLPRPHSPFFSSDAPAPADLGDCLPAYDYLINGGRAWDRLRASSQRRAVLVPAQPIQPTLPSFPREIIPSRPPLAIPANPQIPFSSCFLRLRDFAVAACGTTGQIPVDPSLTVPRTPYSFEASQDNPIADQLEANLGACDRQLFRLLIDYIRAGRGGEITPRWAQEAAARFRPVYQEPYYDPCRANGNKYCP